MFSCEGGYDFYAKDKCFAAFIRIISDQTLAVKFSVQRDAVGWWFQENCQKKKSKTMTFLFLNIQSGVKIFLKKSHLLILFHTVASYVRVVASSNVMVLLSIVLLLLCSK